MSPLLPKRERPWTTDPGHIHDAPEPPPMPDEQEQVGVDIPPEEIEVIQASEESREPHGEPAPVPDPLRGRGAAGPRPGDPARDEALPAEALGRHPRALGHPASLRLVQPGGHPSGGRGDGSDAGLPGVGRHLLRPLPHGAAGRAPGAGLHQHQLLAARRRQAARGLRRRRRRRRAGNLRGPQALRPRVRVHGGLRHRPDGVDRRALLRAAHRGRRHGLRSSSCATTPRTSSRKSGSRTAAQPGGPRGSGDKRLARHPVNKGTKAKPKGKS